MDYRCEAPPVHFFSASAPSVFSHTDSITTFILTKKLLLISDDTVSVKKLITYNIGHTKIKGMCLLPPKKFIFESGLVLLSSIPATRAPSNLFQLLLKIFQILPIADKFVRGKEYCGQSQKGFLLYMVKRLGQRFIKFR